MAAKNIFLTSEMSNLLNHYRDLGVTFSLNGDKLRAWFDDDVLPLEIAAAIKKDREKIFSELSYLSEQVSRYREIGSQPAVTPAHTPTEQVRVGDQVHMQPWLNRIASAKTLHDITSTVEDFRKLPSTPEQRMQLSEAAQRRYPAISWIS